MPRRPPAGPRCVGATRVGYRFVAFAALADYRRAMRICKPVFGFDLTERHGARPDRRFDDQLGPASQGELTVLPSTLICHWNDERLSSSVGHRKGLPTGFFLGRCVPFWIRCARRSRIFPVRDGARTRREQPDADAIDRRSHAEIATHRSGQMHGLPAVRSGLLIRKLREEMKDRSVRRPPRSRPTDRRVDRRGRVSAFWTPNFLVRRWCARRRWA